MRILHVSSEYPPQKVFGLGRYVSDLARELALQGHEVHVLTNSIGRSELDVEDRGVHLHRVQYPPPPMPPTPGAPVMAFNLHLQQRSLSLGRKGLGDPEVVVSHDWLTALAGHRIARRLDIPHVWTVHDTVYGKRFGAIRGAEDQVAHALELWATRDADLILVNSVAIGEEIAKIHGAKSERVHLLHPGLDLSSCEASQEESRLQAFRSAFARPDQTLITFTGRLDLEKGIDTLINAFSFVKVKCQEVRLVIAGRGVLRETIEEHIRKLGLEKDVWLCGYLEGQVLRSFYSISDIHVCPSLYEPFGLVALEAMAAGAVVVASDTGGLRDIVTSTKVGRKVKPGDVAALAGTLTELVNAPRSRKQIGLAGKKHARQKFGLPQLARRAADLYARAEQHEKLVAV